MHSARKMTAIAGAALSALLLAGLLLVPSGAALAGPPEPRELTGLREAPNIPVGSIFLRRALPGHPLPPAVEREFPGPDAPGVEGRRAPPGGGCDKDVDLTGTIETIDGVVNVAAQDNGFCTNADIDTYVVDDETGTYTYVVQAGGEEGAWTHTDVSDPSNPVIDGQFVWEGAAGRATYTPDIKAFSQDGQDYIVMALERMKVRAFCGVVIYNVTDPANPEFESQFIGSDWCDVHNVFVEQWIDADDDPRTYIYVTADGPNDLRVLDISEPHVHTTPPPDVVDCTHCVANPVEIGRYVAPTANNDNYVHDVTVLYHLLLDTGADDGRRVYLSYWDSGLIILKAAEVTLGTNAVPVVGPVLDDDGDLDVTNVINPPGFKTHHAWASADGSYVFIQDEFLDTAGDEPVQMWDVTDAVTGEPAYRDGLVLGDDVPVNPAHNLEIRYDIAPERLYVAWYKLGLQAWDFDSVGGGFLPPGSPAVFHQVQTEANDDEYSGAWGVRLEMITVDDGGEGIEHLYIFQSDRNFGLIIDCEDCATLPTPPTASFTHDACVVDESCSFDGSGSSDDGTITAYDWDFNGNGTTDDTGVLVEHTFLSIGIFSVTLTVGDGSLTDSDTKDVPVSSGGGTGTIKGTVYDANGTRLRDVTVTTDITEGSATTNRRGMYSIKNVPAGDVTVTAEADGFVFEQITVEVLIGQTTAGVDFFALVPDDG